MLQHFQTLLCYESADSNFEIFKRQQSVWRTDSDVLLDCVRLLFHVFISFERDFAFA
jgi:hypothetical protein